MKLRTEILECLKNSGGAWVRESLAGGAAPLNSRVSRASVLEIEDNRIFHG